MPVARRAARIWNIDAGKELAGEIHGNWQRDLSASAACLPLGLHASVNISGMDQRRPILLQFAAFLRLACSEGVRLALRNRCRR